MKQILFFCFLLLFSINVFSAQYTLDPDHSYAEWSVSHFGFSHNTGKFYMQGVFAGDPKYPTRSGVSVVIPISTLATGITRFDELLLGKNFFDAEHFPTAFFRSSKIELTGNDTAKIYGTLTIRNTWVPIVLNVKLEKHDKHPYHHKDAYGFSGTTSFHRSDFGILAYLPGVSDQVDVRFEVEAILVPPASIATNDHN